MARPGRPPLERVFRRDHTRPMAVPAGSTDSLLRHGAALINANKVPDIRNRHSIGCDGKINAI